MSCYLQNQHITGIGSFRCYDVEDSSLVTTTGVATKF